MHRLAAVNITNFRSCSSINLSLSDFTPLVGYNNAGKSNILRAIEWLVAPEVLSDGDFYDSGQAVAVTGHIDGIDEVLLERIGGNHRTAIEGFLVDGRLSIRRTQPTPNCARREVVIKVLDPATSEWRANPTGIDNAIKNLLPEPVTIGAMDNVAEDATKHKNTTTIGKLIGKIVGQVQDTHGANISQTLEGLREKLHANGTDRPAEMRAIDEGATRSLREIFPGIEVKLHVPLPDVQTLFKSGTIFCYENGVERDFASLGHGSQRSIQMALVRYLAELSRGADNGSRCLLLLEEPELYLHPHAIECLRSALKTLSMGSYQVVVATHSPLFIGREDIPQTIQVRKDANRTQTLPTIRSKVAELIEGTPHQADMLFSLSHSSQILFADKVLLTEGKTERKLFPLLFEKYRGTTLGTEKIAIVDQGGGDNTLKSMQLLEATGLPTKTAVDLDKAFKLEGLLEADDVDIVACKTVLGRLSVSFGFNLSEQGLPKNGGRLTTEEAFAKLAEDAGARPHVLSIHSRLKAHNIWLWPLGAIEQHLGIVGKKDSVHAAFARRLSAEEFDAVVADHQGIKEFFDWLVS